MCVSNIFAIRDASHTRPSHITRRFCYSNSIRSRRLGVNWCAWKSRSAASENSFFGCASVFSFQQGIFRCRIKAIRNLLSHTPSHTRLQASYTINFGRKRSIICACASEPIKMTIHQIFFCKDAIEHIRLYISNKCFCTHTHIRARPKIILENRDFVDFFSAHHFCSVQLFCVYCFSLAMEADARWLPAGIWIIEQRIIVSLLSEFWRIFADG